MRSRRFLYIAFWATTWLPRKPFGAYRPATGVTRDAARGNALGICKDQGPQRCAVMSGCSGQPPILSVTP
jgi:hypothetical protein